MRELATSMRTQSYLTTKEMKTKEQHIEEKFIAIAEQVEHIKRCVYMIKRISKYSKPKHVGTYWRRAMRTFGYVASIRSSLIHIEMIMAQPYPPQEGLPFVGNTFVN